MIKRLLLLILLFYCIGIPAQEGNPFDIGSKSSQQAQDTISDRQEQRSDNPFDLNHQPSTRASDSPFSSSQVDSTPVRSNPIPNHTRRGPSDLIILIYSILMLVTLTIGINLNRKRFMMILRSAINSNHLKNLYKDHRAWTEIQSFVLYGLFFSNAAFLLGLLNTRFWENRLPSILLLLVGVILAYGIRHLVMWIISYVYAMDMQVGQHNYSIGLHNMITGVLIAPFILSFGFLPEGQGKFLLYALVAIVGLVYLSRQVKGLLSALTMRGFNLFYFFIYLCAIEIAPLLVAWKIVSGAL